MDSRFGTTADAASKNENTETNALAEFSAYWSTGSLIKNAGPRRVSVEFLQVNTPRSSHLLDHLEQSLVTGGKERRVSRLPFTRRNTCIDSRSPDSTCGEAGGGGHREGLEARVGQE